jgi:UDP-N-acetylmuramoyl-L-alanyl-D-glutamate--2,6-diaminopimelate ligase
MTLPDATLSLRDLLDSLHLDYQWVHVPGALDASAIPITQLSHAHTEAEPGALHFCIRGAAHDGHEYAREAVGAGAVALVCAYRIEDVPVPQIQVENVRQAMAQIACAFYGHPSSNMSVVGITGTNGKSTTTHMVRDILRALRVKVRTYGTLTGRRTTPESLLFQRRLAEAAAVGTSVVVTEVTSHSLVQYRVLGTSFRVAAFTNLSRDHLDYHKSMENYFRAKARLFDAEVSERCVVNVSTEWGVQLAGMIDPPRLQAFDPREVGVTDLTLRGANIHWRGHSVYVPVSPRFYINNAITAAEIVVALGYETEKVAGALGQAHPIRGRYEQVYAGQEFAAVVDYAHTPDALSTVLADTREICPRSNLTVVFGCGGDQSQDEREQMGAIAASMTDHIILTSDNPKYEDPQKIINEITSGIPAELHPKVSTIVDRSAAIASAVQRAEPGDVVLVVGKGHEQYQEIQGVRHPFQDQQILRAELAKWVDRNRE